MPLSEFDTVVSTSEAMSLYQEKDLYQREDLHGLSTVPTSCMGKKNYL